MTFLSERRVWLPAVTLLLLGAALYLPMLGQSGLWDPWEPKYAQAAREMADGGHWVIPHYREDPRLNKPPVTYWLIRLSQSLFGVTEAAARLPSALLAIACPLALFLAFAARGRSLAGFLAGAALLTGPQWLLLGRFATPDMPLASFLGLALAAVVAMPAVDEPGPRRALLILLVLALAAAAMTDGLRGLALPAWGVLAWGALSLGWPVALGFAAVAALFHLGQLQHHVGLQLASFALTLGLVALVLVRGKALRVRELIGGALILAALVAPWFVAAASIQPEEMSILEYKHGLNLGESIGQHTGPYDTILRIVVIGALPWAALAIVGMIGSFGKDADRPGLALAGAWLGATLFFTLSEAQMGHFYGVIQPSLAGLAGLGAVRLVRRRDWTAIPALATCVVVLWLLIDRPSRLLEPATVKSSLFGAAVLPLVLSVAAVWALVLAAAWVRRREGWTVVSVLPAAVLAGGLAFWLVPSLGPTKSLRGLWHSYEAERRGDEPLAAFLKPKDSGFYYSNNSIVRVKTSEELSGFLSGPGTKYLIMPKGARRQLRRHEPQHWETVDDSHPTHVLARYNP